MTGINETILIMGFISFVFVIAYKLYNIMHNNENNNYANIFLSFIGGLFSWGLIFFMSIVGFADPSTLILFKFSSFMLPFLILLLFIELMMMFKKINGQNRGRYEPNRTQQ